MTNLVQPRIENTIGQNGATVIHEAGAAILILSKSTPTAYAETRFEVNAVENGEYPACIRVFVEIGELAINIVGPDCTAGPQTVTSGIGRSVEIQLRVPQNVQNGKITFKSANSSAQATVAHIENIRLGLQSQNPPETSSISPQPTRSYRIGFLNPWREKAENQAFHSLKIAAERLGHALLEVSNSDQILDSKLDFVLAAASTQPKLTNIPTFGVIHEPRIRFWEDQSYFDNLVTYDGYLTISDTLHRFLKAFCAGIGKISEIGFFFNTPQKQELEIDLERLIESGKFRLCYFGTNWDPRMRPVFRGLADRAYTNIYGPPSAWEYLNGASYCGDVPFDGCSVQATYAAFGAGLVSLSRHHALDDVVSNRIFEISSVGAIAICPDIPWIRKHFGDSVFYYQPFTTKQNMIGQIDIAMEAARADPRAAAERGKKAKAIFEEKFSAEVLLSNAVRYFRRWSQTEGASIPPLSTDPLIDVIIRVGGRGIEIISRALHSIDEQTRGRFRLIFVRYRFIDLSPIVNSTAHWRRITEFEIVDEFGGGRAATLVAGLKAVRGEYFCVLDDDDFWLPGHMRGLLAHIPSGAQGRAYVFGGYLEMDETVTKEDRSQERRRIVNIRPPSGDIFDIMGTFAPHCWLASSDLLDCLDLEDWTLRTAEDSVVQARLIAAGDPVFVYQAAACSVRGSVGASNYTVADTRDEDVFECFLRIHSVINEIERKFLVPSMSNWARLNWALRRVIAGKTKERLAGANVLALEEGVAGTSIREREDIDYIEIALTEARVSLMGQSRFVDALGGPGISIHAPSQPWAYGAVIDLIGDDFSFSPKWVVVEFALCEHEIGVGLLNEQGSDFASRMEVPMSTIPVEVWLVLGETRRGAHVVIQNWAQPAEVPTLLRNVWLVKPRLAS